ncbi:MAG: hypothetical protein QM813_11675 [Verrucomicrobiota bacterium]
MSDSPHEILKERFHRFLHRRKDDGKVVDEIARQFRSRGWTVFAFGGTPRGVYDSRKTYTPRDLDLVFEDDHFESFESAYSKNILRKNNFGGIKLQIQHVVIDAWPLSATWAFRNGYVKNPSWNNLPATTFLNLDGIIIEFAPQVLKNRVIYESNFFSGWNSKTLEINLVQNPFPAVCVARTLTISRNFGFLISAGLAFYLYEILNKIAFSSIEGAQRKHYGQVKFEFKELRQIGRKIEKYLSGNITKPLALFPPRLSQPDLFESVKQLPLLDYTNIPLVTKSSKKCLDSNSGESFIANLAQTGFEFMDGGSKNPVTNKRLRPADLK